MNFAEALAQTAPKRDNRCSAGKLIDSLKADQREQVDAALPNRDMQTSHLARALSLMAGTRIDPQTLGRHRKGGCNCGA